MKLEELLDLALHENASDLHLSAGLPPMVRVNGIIIALDTVTLTPDLLHGIIASSMTEEQFAEWEEEKELDYSLDYGGIARFRVNAFFQVRGPAASLRLVPQTVHTLDELGAPPIVRDSLRHRNGLVLVTGPTGSGKSTTLASMIDHLNTHMGGHIITIEDPIEFVHSTKKAIVNQRELGAHTNSFANAMKASLREDPDIILVGEMRDRETMQLALSAAETGHLVFGTLHTNSAAKAVDRIVDMFMATEKPLIRTMLSESLRVVICQALIPSLDGGRVAAYEIMVATPPIRNLIREGKIAQMNSTIQTGVQQGMQTMEQAVQKLKAAGKISAQAASDALDGMS